MTTDKAREAARRRSADNFRKHYAYHEAGHAVFAWFLGHHVREVRISVNDASERPENKAACLLDWAPSESDEILVALAGSRGQELLVKRLGIAYQSNAWADLATVGKILETMPGATPKATAQRLRYFTRQSRDIAARDDVKAAIHAVAAALLERETATGADVEKLCAAAGLVRE